VPNNQEKGDFLVFWLKIDKKYQKKHAKSLSGGWFAQSYKKFKRQVPLVYKEIRDFRPKSHFATALMTRGYETRFCSPQSEIWTCGTGPYRGRF
jgi:hypothetical protein